MSNLLTEEWRPVPGLEGRYSVSNFGNVRGEANQRVFAPHLLRPVNTNGYLRVSLCEPRGRVSGHYVHALVACAFLGPRAAGTEVNHIDGVKANNAASNLEYVTRLENMRHASRFDLTASGDRNGTRKFPERRARGSRQGGARLTEQLVQEIRLDRSKGETFDSLAARHGVARTTVMRAVSGECWAHVTEAS